jgi:hypothetical protein
MWEAVWFAVFLVAVCAAAGAEEIDTWIAVTRTNQIAGIWEGATIFAVPSPEDQMMPDARIAMTLTLRYTEDAENITMTAKMDFSQFLSDWSAFIGISEDALWEILSLSFKDDNAIETGAYFVSMSYDRPVAAAIDAAAGDDTVLFINASGTKLKLQLDNFSQSAVSGFVSPAFAKDVILYRQ